MSSPEPGSKPLVIGVGNRHRGDDAVGPIVARLVAERCGAAVEMLEADGDLSDLALRWRSDQDVVIVDAMVTGGEPGTLIEIDGAGPGRPTTNRPMSSHGIGVAEAVELARLLDRLPRSLIIVAIEGDCFDLFAPPSQPVSASVGPAADRIVAILGLVPTETAAADLGRPAPGGHDPVT